MTSFFLLAVELLVILCSQSEVRTVVDTANQMLKLSLLEKRNEIILLMYAVLEARAIL